MAKDKNDAAAAASKNAPFWLPQGTSADAFKDEELIDVGGFTPIYKPKNAWAGGVETAKLKPVRGFPVGLEYLSLIEAENDNEEDRIPLMARVILAEPNVGYRGKRGAAEEKVELKAGDDIYVPINGNLLYNRPFMVSLFDPTHVTFTKFTVTGQMPMAQGDMWVWRVQFSPNKVARSQDSRLRVPELRIPPDVYAAFGEKIRKALPANAVMRAGVLPQGGGVTPSGHVYDKDGVVHNQIS